MGLLWWLRKLRGVSCSEYYGLLQGFDPYWFPEMGLRDRWVNNSNTLQKLVNLSGLLLLPLLHKWDSCLYLTGLLWGLTREWWHIPVIPALRKPGQENDKFELNWNMQQVCLKTNKLGVVTMPIISELEGEAGRLTQLPGHSEPFSETLSQKNKNLVLSRCLRNVSFPSPPLCRRAKLGYCSFSVFLPHIFLSLLEVSLQDKCQWERRLRSSLLQSWKASISNKTSLTAVGRMSDGEQKVFYVKRKRTLWWNARDRQNFSLKCSGTMKIKRSSLGLGAWCRAVLGLVQPLTQRYLLSWHLAAV